MAQRSFPAAPPNPSTPLIPVPASGAPISAASPSLLSRTQKFIEDNQKLLILGAAVAVSAGAGYYLYNRQSDGSKPGASGSGSSSSSTAGAGAGASAKKNPNMKD